MEVASGKGAYSLCVKSTTWYKDSHSLFDYESSKISSDVFSVSLKSRSVTLYRNRTSCKVTLVDSLEAQSLDPETYQLLTHFQLQVLSPTRASLLFLPGPPSSLRKLSSDRLNTEESVSQLGAAKEEETYLIVRKQKDQLGDQKGYRIEPGQSIKLGRVEFYVSEVSSGSEVRTAKSIKERFYGNRGVMKYDSQREAARKGGCKICLQETQEAENFLFNPCNCSGSCGTVHLECLLQWIHVKVKKEIIGGTLHYNFEKFECEVCKSELPIVVELEDGSRRELLPIEKPQGSYLILEGACEKTKSVVVIQNVPEAGIKLGRGHECEIRITDISVSRNHAMIKCSNGEWTVFDNKSKFGTLVRKERLDLEVSHRVHQGVQIGRTVVTFDLRREKDIKKGQPGSEPHFIDLAE